MNDLHSSVEAIFNELRQDVYGPESVDLGESSINGTARLKDEWARSNAALEGLSLLPHVDLTNLSAETIEHQQHTAGGANVLTIPRLSNRDITNTAAVIES